MSNADTVRSIYAAFGRGDVPAILEVLADDVDWDFAHAPDLGVPYLVPRRGRQAVLGFFQAVADTLELRRFEITDVLGDGPVVVALATVEWIVKPTGKPLREADEAHVWRFDARGKVARFRHGVDTHAHVRAFQR